MKHVLNDGPPSNGPRNSDITTVAHPRHLQYDQGRIYVGYDCTDVLVSSQFNKGT